MRIDAPLNVCEEILDFLGHANDRTIDTNITSITKHIGKTPGYTKKAIVFLEQLQLINKVNSDQYQVDSQLIDEILDGGVNHVIGEAIAKFQPFVDYLEMVEKGKSEKDSLKINRTVNGLDHTDDQVQKIYKKWAKYLSDISNGGSQNEVTIDSKMKSLIEDGFQKPKQKRSSNYISTKYVNLKRIEELRSVNSPEYDLKRLISKCEELNRCYENECFFSCAMLVRSIIDHVPPIFGKNNFSEVTGSYGTRSFKDSMIHLEKSSRKIADSYLHTHIRRKESLPNETQVDFSRDLDVLLAEIIRIL